MNAEARAADQLMEGITVLLNREMLKYNWVGFYMLEPGANPPMLVLGHYQGAMTPHTRIPLNQGICGAAASSGKTVVVDDVMKDLALSCLLARNQVGDRGARLCARRGGAANSISTAISRRHSASKTANWLNIARSSSASGWRASEPNAPAASSWLLAAGNHPVKLLARSQKLAAEAFFVHETSRSRADRER